MHGRGRGFGKPRDPQQMPGPGPGLQQRFKEMDAQESLIAIKKRQIEQKMLEDKRKEQEKQLNKLQSKGKKDIGKVTPLRFVVCFVCRVSSAPTFSYILLYFGGLLLFSYILGKSPIFSYIFVFT